MKLRDGKVKKKPQPLPSPHRLRDTFCTAANEASVDKLSLKLLVNHTLPKGDITDNYIRPSVEHLRAAVNRVASYLLEKKRPKVESK